MSEDNQQVPHEIQIDENIAELVATLNNLAGISTNSSCGGHEQPGPGQAPATEWYVDFNLLPHHLAWQSLEQIAMAIDELLRIGSTIELKVWYDGGIRFELRGYDCDPDELAELLEYYLGTDA